MAPLRSAAGAILGAVRLRRAYRHVAGFTQPLTIAAGGDGLAVIVRSDGMGPMLPLNPPVLPTVPDRIS